MRKVIFLMTVCALALTVGGYSDAAQTTMHAGGHMSSSMQSSEQGAGHYVNINGEKIFYQVSGSGEPLLLIHGYPLDSNLFMKQRQNLSRNFKVITPDLPGFGKSTARTDNASLKAYAKTMFGLMDQLGIQKAIIGGHSMGGMTVLEMYKEQPQRFKGMILIDTAAIAAPLPRKKLWMGYADLAEKPGNHTKQMDKLLIPNMLSDHTRMHDKRLVMEFKDMVKAASTKGVIGGGKALADRPDNSSVLSQIKCPTLIIVGSEDTITPVPIAKKMHQEIKGSKLAIIDGASHGAIIEKAQQADHAIMAVFGQSRQSAQTAR